jgi:hypothetical protein
MVSYTAELIAAPRQTLVPFDALPDIFLPLINDAWLQLATACVFHVVVGQPNATAWAEVGEEVLGDVLAAGQQVGMCVDGDWPAETILHWLRETDRQEVPAVVDLQWLLSPHPISPHPIMRTTHNVRWLSLHQTVPTWVPPLWRRTDSDRFHVGCDLMIVAYQTDRMTTVQWDQPATLATFGRAVAQAAAWLIPRDGNTGFFVGARVGTPLYAKLTHRA